MNREQLMRLFADTAYVRTGGSEAELRCAEYIAAQCESLGLSAAIEPFPVDMAELKTARFTVDGEPIPCKGYLCAGSGQVEAPLYYLPNTDPASLAGCRGKIVMPDGHLGRWTYQDILQNGAVGFVTYDGDVHYADRDMDQRELRSYVSQGKKLPGVNINAKDAVQLIRRGGGTARIELEQDEYQGQSRNVTLDLPGETEEEIVFTAHYDSTSLSQGAYDNMSGSVGLLALAEHFSKNPHRHGLRFVWCGSEERGLLGSKAYTAAHEAELEKFALNVNLDMIGSVMGKFIACVTGEDKLVHYIEYMASELGFGMAARQGVYSSDSTPFADKGVPAVSFARLAPHSTATIHNAYDTADILSPERLAADIGFIEAFAERMANAVKCPVGRVMPENMKEELDYYLLRKRKPK